jgi:fermentation-respiration switch protein FrsA (DUF1100 family)
LPKAAEKDSPGVSSRKAFQPFFVKPKLPAKMKPAARKRLRRTLYIVISAFLLCVGGATYLFYFALARKAPYNPDAASETDSMAAEGRARESLWMAATGFERLSLRAKDGTPLEGYYLAAPTVSRRTALLVHGYGTHAGLMAGYAQFYLADGFNVCMPDNRAHGASGGFWIGMGWLDKDDLEEWLRLLIRKNGSDSQILLHGVSMGASAIMMMNAEGLPSQVKCMVEDCGYTSAAAEFRHQLDQMFGLPSFPLLHIASLEAKIIAGYGFEEASALRYIKTARAPTFFIHGEADTFVPPSMARELYETASCEKQLWMVPGAGHAMAYYADPGEYIRRVRAFYGKYMEKE